MKRIYLLYCSDMKNLAVRVAARIDSITLCPIEWKRLPDGYPDLFLPWVGGLHGEHVAFLASFSSPAVIMEQLSVIYEVPRKFVASFTLVLPYFPTWTSERREEEGDIAPSFTLARMLSNIPLSRGGPTSLVIFDIHAMQERFYFGDAVLPCFMSGLPQLKNRLRQLPDAHNVTIAFPDEGAWTRLHKQFKDHDNFPTIVCTKRRGPSGTNCIVQLKEGDPLGRHVVIVDDLVQSGSTLIECRKMLAMRGAARVSAYATHGVFENRSWVRFNYDNKLGPAHGFAYVWITDSCPKAVGEVSGVPPFEVLSLAAPILEALYISGTNYSKYAPIL